MDEITRFLISGMRCDTEHHWLNELFLDMTKAFIAFFSDGGLYTLYCQCEECHFYQVVAAKYCFFLSSISLTCHFS